MSKLLGIKPFFVLETESVDVKAKYKLGKKCLKSREESILLIFSQKIR